VECNRAASTQRRAVSRSRSTPPGPRPARPRQHIADGMQVEIALPSSAIVNFVILKIAVFACYQVTMIQFMFDLAIGLATFAALTAAFFGKPGAGLRARNRPWGWDVALPCCFPAGPRSRDMFFPAGRARDFAQAIDYTSDYRQDQADFGAETKILPVLREARARAPLRTCRARGWRRRGRGPPVLTAAGGEDPYDSVAVVGSIIRRTSVILFAGKPLRRACS
jgi:hypothetical protein